MENDRKKWISGSYLAVAGLVAYLLFTAAFGVVARYDLETRIPSIDWAIRIGSAVIGLVVFGVLYSNAQANKFMDEVFVELSRVTWPSRDETLKATWVVIVMVMISGLVLGGLDVFWAWAVHQIL